ncbi:MAG: penicillin-binding transpeptidase domain-containing protein [Anaerolineae bacterium]
MKSRTPNSDTQLALQRLNRVILIGFTAVALALVYWSVARSDILTREDNPRVVEAELRIQRGPIMDRHDIILAENVGTPARQQRLYPEPAAVAAVGYYSLRHGTAGVEESYDAILRGSATNFWTGLVRKTLHEPQVGQPVQLTLDAGLQETAVTLLNGHSGALLLLDLSQPGMADVLALASTPTYDPNLLDEEFDDLLADESAPLLNRVTQGQYQPGLVLQPFILAAALDQGLINLEDTAANANRNIPVNGVGIRCASPPPQPTTLADVLRYRCPGPMQELADRLGIAGLDQIFADFGLTTEPQFALDSTAPESEPIVDPLLAGIGQENLTVTPLQVGLAWAALMSNSRLPTPRLVTAVPPVSRSAIQPVSNSGEIIRQTLPQHEGITEYSRLVLSGPEGSTNGWYLGAMGRIVVVVVIEESEQLTAVETMGRAILETAP